MLQKPKMVTLKVSKPPSIETATTTEVTEMVINTETKGDIVVTMVTADVRHIQMVATTTDVRLIQTVATTTDVRHIQMVATTIMNKDLLPGKEEEVGHLQSLVLQMSNENIPHRLSRGSRLQERHVRCGKKKTSLAQPIKL